MTTNRNSTLTVIAVVSAMVASVAFWVTEAAAQFHKPGGAQQIRGTLSLANEPAEGIGSPLNRAGTR